jgi:hypothetical protein
MLKVRMNVGMKEKTNITVFVKLWHDEVLL